jgi:5-methylcytosine-specific restriction endonuclease McrA
MPTNLDAAGLRILHYLVRIAPSIDLQTHSGFPTYSNVHNALGLQMIGRTWGDSLDRQGMGQVAEWAKENCYPSITGFIISGETRRPADGYFKYYSKDPDADLSWWLSEVASAKAFSWPKISPSGVATSTASKSQVEEMPRHPLQNARTVAEIVSPNSRFFIKSEWGPISKKWPALSFSKRSVGDYLNREYRPASDFIVYAGTSNAERTEVPGHRQRLLSILIAEPGEPVATAKLVPWDSWQDALKKHDKAWPYSFGVRAAWELTDMPRATEITPVAYRAMGIRSNWGGVAEILGSERDALKALSIEWVELPNRDVVEATASKRDRLREIRENRLLSAALARLEALVKGRIGPWRMVWTETPSRSLPAGTNLTFLLQDKLVEQNYNCALCGKLMRLDTTKKLFQVSPDRIVSTNPSYGADNLQITHLACNLAKNDGSTEDFEEWLQCITGNDIIAD